MPASRPSHIAQPAGDECNTGLKKPPVVQPPASAAPMPSIFAAWGYGPADTGEHASATARTFPELFTLATGLRR